MTGTSSEHAGVGWGEPDSDIQRVAIELFARRTAAILVPRRPVSIDGWKPTPQEAYKNASEWSNKAAGHRARRGWLYFDFTGFEFATVVARPFHDLVAHSIIETTEGLLVDITPAPPSTGLYPFIAHVGSDEAYAELVGKRGVFRIRLYSRPDGGFTVTLHSR